MSTRPQKTRQALLQRGLEILSEQGIEKLTIDNLCVELGLTKGSFYHHFKNREHFHTSLLEFWMEEHTERKKTMAEEKGTPEEKYIRILEYAATLPHDLEKAIRSWAMCNPLAAEYQTKVDTSRINYLTNLLGNMLPDRNQAQMMARIVLSTMIGSRHLFPPLLGAARQQMMRELHSLMGIKLPIHAQQTNGDLS